MQLPVGPNVIGVNRKFSHRIATDRVQKLRMLLPVGPNVIGVNRKFSHRIATDRVQKLRMLLSVGPNVIGVNRTFSHGIATDSLPKRQNFYRRTVDKVHKINHSKYFITFSEICRIICLDWHY
jgi:hypothetical protein